MFMYFFWLENLLLLQKRRFFKRFKNSIPFISKKGQSKKDTSRNKLIKGKSIKILSIRKADFLISFIIIRIYLKIANLLRKIFNKLDFRVSNVKIDMTNTFPFFKFFRIHTTILQALNVFYQNYLAVKFHFPWEQNFLYCWAVAQLIFPGFYKRFY